ncbi:hypothetical protein [Streptomyces sp. NPDC001286]
MRGNTAISTAAVVSAALTAASGTAGEASAPSFLVPRNGADIGARF